jgi:hypothetical protein
MTATFNLLALTQKCRILPGRAWHLQIGITIIVSTTTTINSDRMKEREEEGCTSLAGPHPARPSTTKSSTRWRQYPGGRLGHYSGCNR